MNICEATKADGMRCRNQIPKGRRYCGHHRGRVDWKRALLTGGGALLGNLLVPGLGGAVGGAIAGKLVDRIALTTRAKRRVFLSFDYSHDRKMKTLFLGQAKLEKSPFEVVDHSLQEAAPEAKWTEHAAEAIASAELVLVLIGQHTSRARGVLIEVEMARRLGRPVVQVYAYKDMRGLPLLGVKGPYLWDWNILAHLLD